jgi:succinate dehydrogenase / fumarate reductase, iron-sulfur subunit
LACVTPVVAGGGDITVEPLANAPVVSDLVVDMGDLYAHLAPVGHPLLRAVQVPGNGTRASRFEDCIECGLCVSACPISGSDPDYLGPAGLAAACRTVEEPRGPDPVAVLARVDDPHGCWRCHLAMECSRACPSGVDPAAAIMSLRRRLVRRRAGGLLRRAEREPGR